MPGNCKSVTDIWNNAQSKEWFTCIVCVWEIHCYQPNVAMLVLWQSNYILFQELVHDLSCNIVHTCLKIISYRTDHIPLVYTMHMIRVCSTDYLLEASLSPTMTLYDSDPTHSWIFKYNCDQYTTVFGIFKILACKRDISPLKRFHIIRSMSYQWHTIHIHNDIFDFIAYYNKSRLPISSPSSILSINVDHGAVFTISRKSIRKLLVDVYKYMALQLGKSCLFFRIIPVA